MKSEENINARIEYSCIFPSKISIFTIRTVTEQGCQSFMVCRVPCLSVVLIPGGQCVVFNTVFFLKGNLAFLEKRKKRTKEKRLMNRQNYLE